MMYLRMGTPLNEVARALVKQGGAAKVCGVYPRTTAVESQSFLEEMSFAPRQEISVQLLNSTVSRLPVSQASDR